MLPRTALPPSCPICRAWLGRSSSCGTLGSSGKEKRWATSVIFGHLTQWFVAQLVCRVSAFGCWVMGGEGVSCKLLSQEAVLLAHCQVLLLHEHLLILHVTVLLLHQNCAATASPCTAVACFCTAPAAKRTAVACCCTACIKLYCLYFISCCCYITLHSFAMLSYCFLIEVTLPLHCPVMRCLVLLLHFLVRCWMCHHEPPVPPSCYNSHVL